MSYIFPVGPPFMITTTCDVGSDDIACYGSSWLAVVPVQFIVLPFPQELASKIDLL